MLDLIVFVKASGINARLDNLCDMVGTFVNKNKNLNYKFYFVLDAGLEVPLIRFIKAIKQDDKVMNIVTTNNSWAADFNNFISVYKRFAKWLLIAHDDVTFVTDNYFTSITDTVKGHEDKIGWITSTSEYYYKFERKMTTDTFRPGFYKDNDKWGKGMFQLHNRNLDNPDYPKSAVKIHGPMSAIMITTMKSMEKIGFCEDWTRYTMLIDEDWSLEALKNNLWNVWVPHVHHLHPNRRNLRKANNRWMQEAHAGLKSKWGFDVEDAVASGWKQGVSISLENLRTEFAETNIPWSSYRKSYDWESLDD
jgi:hypothetical protein